MRAKLSIVIPVLDAASPLALCLNSLAEGLQAGLIRELIVSDGGSTDGTIALAEAAGAEVLTGPASRGGQLRRGVAAASGEWLLILHADTRLPEGWADAAAAHMARGGAAYFPMRFDHGGLPARAVAAWANLRARVFGLPYGDQGLLISRTEYDAAGGYPDIPLMEDVALIRALKGRAVPLPVTLTTSAGKYLRDGWLRRGGQNLWRLARYLMGADPEQLARRD